jgi:LysR family transcriptional regulator, low CO2-responsive transcriptional regulator
VSPRTPMITYTQLGTFLAVVRTRNLTRAARELRASQPTVSLQIRALREAMGAELIERGAKGFRLTPAGEKLRRYAEETLGGLRAVQQEIAALKGTPAGPLAVGVTFALSAHLPAALTRFRAHFPAVEVGVHVDLPEPLFRRVLGDTLDIACYIRVRTPAGLTIEPLGDEELVIIASPRHPLAGRRRITPAELSAHPFVAPAQPVFRELLQDKLRAAGVTPRSVIEVPNNDAVTRLVERDAGYSVYVRPRIAAELASGQLVILELAGAPMLGEIVAAFVSRPVVSPLIREVVRFLRAELGNDRGAAGRDGRARSARRGGRRLPAAARRARR